MVERNAMRTGLWVWVCVLGSLCVGCQRNDVVTPAPGVLPLAGMLLKTYRVPLSDRLELRRYSIHESDVSNDFYPYNISRGKPAGSLVPKLFLLDGRDWRRLDFVEMPLAEPLNSPNLSASGNRLLYARPDISLGEGDWPWLYPHDLRSRQAAVFHVDTNQRFMLVEYTEVQSLGKASFWHPAERTVAFTTRCTASRPFLRTLAIVDETGLKVLDGRTMPALTDLEFICHSPDGKHIAALRPTKPGVGGSAGGTLVEVTPATRTVRDVAPIQSSLGCRFVGRYDQLVGWDAQGRCELKPIDAPSVPAQVAPVTFGT